MEIQRRFTRSGESPYSGISFEPRTSEIRNPDGTAIFHQDNVVVPTHWSQIATDILAQKYFRKRGVTAPAPAGAAAVGAAVGGRRAGAATAPQAGGMPRPRQEREGRPWHWRRGPGNLHAR